MAAILDALKRFLVPADDENEEFEAEREERKVSHVREELPPIGSGAKRAKILSINTAGATNPMRCIVVIKLENNTGAKEIIDHVKAGSPVVFSIARLDRNDAARTVDVIYGASYAVDGNMQKVSTDIFIVAPKGIEITGDIAEEILNSADFSLDI